MDRRSFMRHTAMAAATAAVSRYAGAQPHSAVPEDVRARTGDEVSWHKAPCRFCGTGCHVQVGVKGGRAVSIAGDQLAPVNKGLLCVKGYHTGLILYGRDRLTQPLLKKNGKHEPISWDEALNLVADRVMADPAGFAFYGSGQWTIPEGYAAQKLMKGGLSNNHIDPNARLCMASAVTGFVSTYGVDEPASCFDDLDHADVVITWGNNPAEMHPMLFTRLVNRRSHGEDVTLVDIGTRRTRTTEFAQHYLEFRPHTDLAIANGIANYLVHNGRYDETWVERYVNFRASEDSDPSLFGKAIDFKAYKERVAPYTPEKVSEIAGVPPEQIRMLGEMFADPKLRITSLWCMGMNQHTRGTAINQLVHGIHMLSGHWGREGDGPQSLTGQPSACGTAREVGTLAHALPGGRLVAKDKHRREAEDFWNVPRGRISSEPGAHTVDMFRRFSTPKADGGDIHTLYVQVTNPAQTLPNLHEIFDPSRKDPDKFLIVSDCYPTETTRAADLVLPASMWIEKNGMFGNSERRTQQWFKMVDAPGDARDDCWQTIALARKLYERGHEGMKDRDGRFLFRMEDGNGDEVPVWDWDHYYDINVDERLFEEYRRFSRKKHKNLAPYSEYVKHRGLRWPVVKKNGTWTETRYRFVEGEDPFVDEGKGIQFYHSTTDDGRAQVWFHPYEPPPEEPDETYPFWLCTGRVLEHWHTGTMTMRVPQLRRAMPQAYVEMNRDDAVEHGVRNGEVVTVESRRGKIELAVWIDGRGKPPPGTLFIPFFDERLLVNRVTLHAYDPFSKQPDYKKCAARVRRRG